MADSGRLKALADLSNRAVHEFEETQKKCHELSAKYQHQHDRSQKLESQFKQLKRVSLLAVSEYENLMKRYTDEAKSKEDVQNKLRKVEDENKELRKTNKISPNVSIIPANANKGGGDGATKGELEGLRALMNGMKDEMRRAKTDISSVAKELEEEKRDHESTKHKLKIANAQVQQLNRVSVMALDEFQDLRKKYDAEVELRKKAEQYATQLVNDNQSIVRQSKFISEPAPSDEKLDNAIKEIEELSNILSKERTEHELKLKEIQEELECSKDTQTAKALEDKLSVSLDQIELLQSQLQESDNRAQQHERRAKDLYESLRRTEEAMRTGAPLPAAPPPPPPPPPPLPAPVIRKFITRIGVGKKKKGDIAKEKDDPVQDMMKEMMARINKGTQLKSSHKKNEDGTSPAMNQLADLLTNLKRGQGSSDRPGSVEKKEKVPEFQKFKLRKVSADRAKTEEEMRDNELMRKLGKQKKAAEGEEIKEEDETKVEDKKPSVSEKPRKKSVENSSTNRERLASEEAVDKKRTDSEDKTTRKDDSSGDTSQQLSDNQSNVTKSMDTEKGSSSSEGPRPDLNDNTSDGTRDSGLESRKSTNESGASAAESLESATDEQDGALETRENTIRLKETAETPEEAAEVRDNTAESRTNSTESRVSAAESQPSTQESSDMDNNEIINAEKDTALDLPLDDESAAKNTNPPDSTTAASVNSGAQTTSPPGTMDDLFDMFDEVNQYLK
eukprot:Seg4519.1 transcript_id=Seg4519.1/GoldUCD/mRNA.D3Y31 product=Shootin-1 protein_id=Seg4519.1/GoldUCD/D3Y31